MNRFYELYDLVEKEGIYLCYTDLLKNTRNQLYGLYLSSGKAFSILLDKVLQRPENRRLHKVVLAEELGHHYTVPLSNAIQLFGSSSVGYREEIQMQKDEQKAIAWATNFLMPDSEFNKAVAGGCRTCYDLAEWFDVTEKFVYMKLGIIKVKYRDLGIKMMSRDYFRIRLLEGR